MPPILPPYLHPVRKCTRGRDVARATGLYVVTACVPGLGVRDAEMEMLLLVRSMAMGRYYDCTVQEETAYGYKVFFTSYGNVEEVPLEYLQKNEVLTSAKVRWFKL